MRMKSEIEHANVTTQIVCRKLRGFSINVKNSRKKTCNSATQVEKIKLGKNQCKVGSATI